MTTEQQQRADLAGMIEAEQRYGKSDLQQYHERRDLPGLPYVAGKEQDNGELLPLETKRGLAKFSIVAFVVTGCAGFIQVCATGAMNVVFQYGVGAFVVGILLSSMRGQNRSKNSSSSKYEYHHHYHQNNNFGGGGGANQNNGK